ncbi:hypothetical protein GGS23DRAFT_608781 [Durotheca rogersii]|uniref:uncharacterized protein n=1 Tax=Durotheca rogersii TaxID=419775 RepID=UPI00221F3831|nr:uncharacterized protein GGS23DRAFT_608781 [Durotheca rogersii]KAI5868195.1 hypothetical protein GGS23DRAFT_608781 [Durotheca rogersii]
MVALVDLPYEVLQLIAGKCSALDILALGRTCRRLRDACDSAAVFLMSFEHHLPELSSTAFEDGRALVRFMKKYVDGPRTPCQRFEGPKMTWLCLAVAICRLPIVLQELEHQQSSVIARTKPEPQQLDQVTKESLQGIVGFLATLPIWGYPTACNSEIATILDGFCPLFFSPSAQYEPLRINRAFRDEFPMQFAFCLALCSLRHISGEDGPGRTSLPPVSSGLLLMLVKRHYEGTALGPDFEKFRGSWIGKQTHALLLILLVSRNIYHVSQVRPQLPDPRKVEYIGSWYFAGDQRDDDEHEAFAGAGSLRPRFPILTPNRIAFGGERGRYFYPFAGDEWWSWYTTRVRDLVGRLDEGEWCGAYTYGLYLGGRMDPPMQKIRFRKTEIDGDKYSVEALDAEDGIAPFTLRGEVNASGQACTIRLKKRYPTHGFDWEGLVTPLGICGAYFPVGIQRTGPLGFFWLWRRDWMNDTV